MNTAKKTGLVLVLLAVALILLSLVVPIDWFPSIAWGYSSGMFSSQRCVLL